MSKKLAAVLLVAAICALSLPALAHSLREAIEASDAKWEEAFNSGNAEAVAALYTQSGAVLPPDAARVDGREDIQAFWQGAMEAGVSDVDLRTIEVGGDGDFAYSVGALTLQVPGENGEKVTVAGNFLVVWQRGDDGVWRLHRDMYSFDPPPANEWLAGGAGEDGQTSDIQIAVLALLGRVAMGQELSRRGPDERAEARIVG